MVDSVSGISISLILVKKRVKGLVFIQLSQTEVNGHIA